ncbi:MAG TPA: class I SAM-dependent methyltransferase [Thermoanaerobaculia bacterium]|jgi:2-polyprenyl-3-methyl-5-hydroxy-6-metoxy-1,4-benzoquinol methylase|nr:class I SAM-dependent methyltransferase [Thermoanaerobaculia bacterium]
MNPTPDYRALCPNPGCGSSELATALIRNDPYELDGERRVYSFRFAYCRACQLGFVDPQPPPEVLAAFYPSDYTNWGSPPTTSLAERAKQRLAAWRHRRLVVSGLASTFAGFLGRLGERLARRDASFSLGVPLALPHTTPLLDYGFGAGGFLHGLVRKGFRNLWGYDLPQNLANRDRLRAAGVHAYSGDERDQLPRDHFQCIRLEHVLEHLPEPIATLRGLLDLLSPGGFLVLTVPSIHAWEPIETLAASPYTGHLTLPIHLWVYSERSLADSLAAAGFEKVVVRRLRQYGHLSAVARRPLTDDPN